MSFDPTQYPIVLQVTNGFVVASQPDLEIYRTRGKYSDIRQKEELGAVILDVWEEILKRSKDEALPAPSKKILQGSISKEYTTTEVADAMGVSVATVRRMCDAGKLQTIMTYGGHRRIKMGQPNLDMIVQKKGK